MLSIFHSISFVHLFRLISSALKCGFDRFVGSAVYFIFFSLIIIQWSFVGRVNGVCARIFYISSFENITGKHIHDRRINNANSWKWLNFAFQLWNISTKHTQSRCYTWNHRQIHTLTLYACWFALTDTKKMFTNWTNRKVGLWNRRIKIIYT